MASVKRFLGGLIVGVVLAGAASVSAGGRGPSENLMDLCRVTYGAQEFHFKGAVPEDPPTAVCAHLFEYGPPVNKPQP